MIKKMSVIQFSEEELVSTAKTMISNEHVRRAVEHSSKYKEWYIYHDATRKDDEPRMKLESEKIKLQAQIIKWLMGYVYVANQVAFRVNYTDDKTPIGTELPEIKMDGDVKHMTNFALWKQLRSISYNLYTNGGTIILGAEWEELLDACIARLGVYMIQNGERN